MTRAILRRGIALVVSGDNRLRRRPNRTHAIRHTPFIHSTPFIHPTPAITAHPHRRTHAILRTPTSAHPPPHA